jgi:hypothetical protein
LLNINHKRLILFLDSLKGKTVSTAERVEDERRI